MTTDATAPLHIDHRRILRLLEDLDAPLGPGASAVEERRTRAVELIVAEARHRSVEETLFWPVVRSVLDDGDRLADRAVDHHTHGERLLTGVQHAEAGSAEFEASLAEFIASARSHIAFEEEQVWPRFRAAIDRNESEKLGSRIERFER